MEEETDEYNPFIEESVNDEPINNVSVCVYYDSSRGGDKAAQIGSWARRSKGLITLFYVVRGFGEIETSSDWIKNKVIPPLLKLCPSKYINYDYFETTAKIPDSMLYQYIEEKTMKTLSSGAIIPLSDKNGTNLFGICINCSYYIIFKIAVLSRQALYNISVPTLFTKIEGPILNPTVPTTCVILLPSIQSAMLTLIKKSCFYIRPNDNVVLFHIQNVENDMSRTESENEEIKNENNVINRLIQQGKGYLEKQMFNCFIEIQDIDPNYTIQQQIINYLSHNQSIGFVTVGCQHKNINEKMSFDLTYSIAEYIVRYSRTHTLVVKV